MRKYIFILLIGFAAIASVYSTPAGGEPESPPGLVTLTDQATEFEFAIDKEEVHVFNEVRNDQPQTDKDEGSYISTYNYDLASPGEILGIYNIPITFRRQEYSPPIIKPGRSQL